MSDSMKLKAIPRKCDTCKYDGCLYSQIPDCREHGCVRWIKQEPTLEQRYQQLEQVAKELYAIAFVSWKEARCLAGPQVKRSVESREEHLNRLKDQLETLGVILDD